MTVPAGPMLHDCRDAFSDALAELMAADPRVVAVVNDSLGSHQGRQRRRTLS